MQDWRRSRIFFGTLLELSSQFYEENFYHWSLTNFPLNFPPYFFSLLFFLNQTKKSYFPKFFSFHQIFQGPNGAFKKEELKVIQEGQNIKLENFIKTSGEP